MTAAGEPEAEDDVEAKAEAEADAETEAKKPTNRVETAYAVHNNASAHPPFDATTATTRPRGTRAESPPNGRRDETW